MKTEPDDPQRIPTLDFANQRIERDGELIQLTPKAFVVLERLNRWAGRLVTKDALLEAAWPRVCVGEAVLKVTVCEIRKALADDARAPRYLETVHRRGYRLVSRLKCTEAHLAVIAGDLSPCTAHPGDSVGWETAELQSVGRQAALETLSIALRASLAGDRRVVFVTGAPGSGKTGLIDDWLAGTASLGGERLACARCVCMPHDGTVEPYRPLLDALAGLLRRLGAARSLPLLWRYAPSWLARMPWLVDDKIRHRLQRKLCGSVGHMQREFAELIEVLTCYAPLIMVLEDLQRADSATLDLIGYFVRRGQPCRCCVVATYRTDEEAGSRDFVHSLNLARQGQCEILNVGNPERDDRAPVLEPTPAERRQSPRPNLGPRRR